MISNEKYLKLLYSLNYGFDNDKALVFEWKNGLQTKCNSITGMHETDTEPGDEDYIGEYAAAVGNVEILSKGRDDSVEIYNECIEISLKCIPSKISLEDGTVLWSSKQDEC